MNKSAIGVFDSGVGGLSCVKELLSCLPGEDIKYLGDTLRMPYGVKTKEELKTLKGVGEKTANVVVSLVYNEPAIAVDTHVFRVSNRLGLANANTPEKTQKQLEEVLDKKDWSKFHYALVLHGRYVCKAIKPKCDECFLKNECKFRNVK